MVSVTGLEGGGLGSSATVEYGYGYDGFRTFKKGLDGRYDYWFPADHAVRGGVPEHVLMVGDKVVARMGGNATGGGAVVGGVLKVNWGKPTRLMGLPVPVFLVWALVFGLGLALLLAGLLAGRRTGRWQPGIAGAVGAFVLLAVNSSGCGSAADGQHAHLWDGAAAEVTYVHQSVAAGPVLFTDKDGKIREERRYEPFGVELDSWSETAGPSGVAGFGAGPYGGSASGAAGGLTPDPQNILNKETDRATGWSYHGARWMAPKIARWGAPDPPVKAPDAKFMGDPWGLNPYGYVKQSPTLFWDPDGQDPASALATAPSTPVKPGGIGVGGPLPGPAANDNAVPTAPQKVSPGRVLGAAANLFTAIQGASWGTRVAVRFASSQVLADVEANRLTPAQGAAIVKAAADAISSDSRAALQKIRTAFSVVTELRQKYLQENTVYRALDASDDISVGLRARAGRARGVTRPARERQARFALYFDD